MGIFRDAADFVWAVATNFVTWLSAVVFFLEQGYPYLPDWIRKRIDAWLTPEYRHRLLRRLAALGIVIAMFLAYRDTKHELEEKKQELASLQGKSLVADRVAMKNLIGDAMNQATELLKNYENKDAVAFEHETNFWLNRVGHLVEDAYGSGEARLIMSSAGYTAYSDGKKQTDIRNVVVHRIQRLTELIPRVDSLSFQPGFDPKNYHWVEKCAKC